MEGLALGGRGWGYRFGEGLENVEHASRALHLGVGVQAGARVNGHAWQPIGHHLGLECHQSVQAGRFKGIRFDDLFPRLGLSGQKEGLFWGSHGGLGWMFTASKPF